MSGRPEAQCLDTQPHAGHDWDSMTHHWSCPGRRLTSIERMSGYRDPFIDPPAPPSINAQHLRRQRAWSLDTFGPGERTLGVIDHIRKELDEVAAAPDDASEWADIVILALDGAMRAGIEPQDVIDAVIAKQAKNEAREWPDWRGLPADRAIEHVRTGAS